MIVFPSAATLVATVFTVMLARDYVRSRRPFHALWALAMLLFAGASLALFLGVLDGWSELEFRAYWLLGAVLTVPFLAMGELYLLVPRRWVNTLLMVLLLAGTAVAVATVRTADIDASHLASDLPLGKEVFGEESTARLFSIWYGYPAYFVLLGGTLWSAMRIRGRAEMRDRFLGTLLIAAGSTIVFIASGVGAGLGNFVVFSVGLAAGVTVMFMGFLRATRRPAEAAA